MFGNVALPTSYTFISNNITLESFQSDLLCSGDSSGEASVEMVIPGSGNYTYTWSNSVVEGPVSSTTSLVVGLSSGNYTVTVTDEEGCQATRDFVIEEPQDILIDELVLSHVDVDFPGNPIGAFEVSVEGGTPVYEYSISGTDIWQSSSIFSDLIEGDYIVIVSDLNGCLDSINISIEDLSTSIGGFVSSNIEPSMLIYPNSISSDEAFVVKLMGFGKEKSVSVLFYDILGKKTFEQESVTDAKGFVKSEINQNIFESGIYLVIAYSNKKRCSSRLVIK
jgi:hypothetical protein